MSAHAPSTPNVVDSRANGAVDGTNSRPKYTFGMSEDAWDHYVQYRPQYPDSQWHMWLDYHQGPLDVVHEIGTGCGVGTAGLLRVAAQRGQAVRRAILSDPTASNIATSRARLLSSSPSSTSTGGGGGGGGGTEFAFHQQPAEASFLAPGSVDMAIACECLHCTEADASVARLHESLRPGGTLAAVFYDLTFPEVRGSARATRALRDVIGHLMVGRRPGAVTGPPGHRYRVHIGFGHVPLGPDRWTDVRRVFFNTPEGQTAWPPHPALRDIMPEDDSKVDRDNDALEWIGDPEDWGIRDCTADRIRGMLGTLELKFDPGFWEGPLWREMLDAVDEQGGTVWVVFRASYILARKR